MADYKTGLSNMSYTNKDFGDIFPELLDLAKKLSYKWDPSVSDESDPGVVLLKLAAIIADKNNYNIDKNILELFPSSVTQYSNARQVFDQCGYTMKHYNAAFSEVSFILNTLPSGITDDSLVLTIPRFSMITTPNNEIIYTLTSDVKLKHNGVSVTGPALQGTVIQYSSNGDKIVTIDKLDYNNRIYLSGDNVAENGIFINSVDQSGNELEDFDVWNKVDNLALQDLNTHCYKFGLDSDGKTCYLEFPSDIDNLLGNGICIRYIRTLGSSGNTIKGSLTQFYGEVSANYYDNDARTVAVTTDNITIKNFFPSTDGRDPETIDEAFRNYSKVKNTFKTLVSAKDYSNFMFSNKNISNGFVTDRTNDPQSSYTVCQVNGNVRQQVLEIHKNSSNVSEMNAFNIKLYGLKYVDNPTTIAQLSKSFDVIVMDSSDDLNTSALQQDLEEVKCIQHDWKSFEKNRIILLKNKYPIVVNIIPVYKLSDIQQDEIRSNIVSNLCKKLQSSEMNFGSEADYDTIYDTIINSDSRIRAIALDDIQYETWATYIDSSDNLRELRIDNGYDASLITSAENELVQAFRNEIYAKSVLSGVTQLFKPVSKFNHHLGQSNGVEKSNVSTIRTSVEIPVESTDVEGESKIQLDTSTRNIVLTADNLIRHMRYESGTLYVTNTSISKNSNHELTGSEFIAVLMSHADSTNYDYMIYNKDSVSNVINTSFNIAPTSNSNPVYVKVTALKTAGNVNVLGSVNLSDVSSADKSEVTLSTGSSIELRKPNQVRLNASSNKVFWISNRVSTDTSNSKRSVLFNKDETSRFLDPGEVIMYTSSGTSSFQFYESGTLIERPTADELPEISVPYVSYNDIVDEGLDVLEGKWYKSSTIITVTEQVRYVFGKDSTLTLTHVADDSTHDVHTITKDPVSLDSYNISYIDSSTATSVQQLDVRHGSFAWNCYSVLNIIADTQTPQLLDSNETFTIVSTDSEGQEVTTSYTHGTYILPSRAISIMGGNFVDVTTAGVPVGTIKPLDFYLYSEAELPDGVQKTSTGLDIVSEGSIETYSIQSVLPEGHYILSVTPSKDVPVTIYTVDDQVNNFIHPIGFDANEDSQIHSNELTKLKTYYYRLTSNGSALDLNIKTDANIHLSSLYKYQELEIDTILDTCIAYDSEKLFDYTYVIPAEYLIKDPLDAKSFLNINHPFNKNTICMWNPSTDNLIDNISILNKTK